jgi:hypothetical protein
MTAAGNSKAINDRIVCDTINKIENFRLNIEYLRNSIYLNSLIEPQCELIDIKAVIPANPVPDSDQIPGIRKFDTG